MTDPNEHTETEVTSPTKTPAPSLSQRQSTLLKANRRSNFFYRNLQNEPPIGNPENSDEYNARLKQEYEQLQLINHTLEVMIDDFQKVVNTQKQLARHVDDTDKLLDVWSTILETTEKYKRLIEGPTWEKKEENGQ
ncbi:hypothetical protein G6F70_006856 [Rhizopus microsporus]|uniref:DASH complex subunit DUO1 n=2 Tax=Rhizopus TaxID=4842 RepID=A0A367K6A7_RHIAZ|nr:hypothetical protein G6F71_006817 [Rhizopus microsporus]RCH97792.1 hypothetical protein CU097_014291 [Rhizopus azygosporus]KAG1197157.1 hypothetical protein G6F70_006856 [Rhizopus microsporus]KAG1207923.1 hypothetical protein G6F69_007649 [Rhizopus microsporus]KAG1230373.1 hypothetical protein G6F67_006503 [Rhizopus microsporus]